MEKILEAASFIKDVVDVCRNDFIIREKHSKKVDYLRTGARIAHLISHILMPIVFLSDLKILTVNANSKRIFKLGINLFHLVGFSAFTASLLWKKCMNGNQETHFYSDLAIQMGSLVFYAVPLAKVFFDLKGNLNKISNVASSVAGLTSGLFILYRLHSIETEEKIEHAYLCNVKMPKCLHGSNKPNKKK